MNFLGDIYIHISQCARSDHISQRQDSSVVGRGRNTGRQWLTCAAECALSKRWFTQGDDLTPNLSFHNTVQVKFHNYYES